MRNTTPSVPISRASNSTRASMALAAMPKSCAGLSWKAATKFSAAKVLVIYGTHYCSIIVVGSALRDSSVCSQYYIIMHGRCMKGLCRPCSPAGMICQSCASIMTVPGRSAYTSAASKSPFDCILAIRPTWAQSFTSGHAKAEDGVCS